MNSKRTAVGSKVRAIRRLGRAQRAALHFIATHPGCCAADVDRACRTARGGHRWMYAAIARLARRGLITRRRQGNRFALDVRPGVLEVVS